MAKVVFILLVVMCNCKDPVRAVLHEPFPSGSAAAHLGTIVAPGSHASRSPEMSAVFLDESYSAGIAVSARSLYDDMDNFSGKSLAEVAMGGFVTGKIWSVKAGVTSFDALDIYREQKGILSCAVILPKGITFALDGSGTRLSIDLPETNPYTFAEAAFSLLIPLGKVRCSAQVQHLPVKTTGEGGGGPSPCLRLGLHTIQHAFGTQGLAVVITPDHDRPVNCAIGQELRLHRNFALAGGIQNNPFILGIGIVVSFEPGDASVALVNHPRLGWSRSVAADYRFFPARAALEK